MDFTLSKKHEMARQLFKDFAENEVKPVAQETDETEHFPMETVKKMAKRNTFQSLQVESISEHLVLQSQVQVQMLRVFRLKLYLTEMSGYLMVLSASSQTVRLLMFISLLLIQTSSKERKAERLRNSLHSS